MGDGEMTPRRDRHASGSVKTEFALQPLELSL